MTRMMVITMIMVIHPSLKNSPFRPLIAFYSTYHSLTINRETLILPLAYFTRMYRYLLVKIFGNHPLSGDGVVP